MVAEITRAEQPCFTVVDDGSKRYRCVVLKTLALSIQTIIALPSS